MQLEHKIVYLLLGSNLGDRQAKLEQATELITAKLGPVIASSAWYETAAWGLQEQPDFLNRAIAVKTGLTAHEVLDTVLGIEEILGRVRAEKWGARIIDIDIILYGNDVISDGARLQVPHPLMLERKFVMEPLAEIAGDLIHPVAGKDISTLLSLLQDNSDVSKII
ncbi:2-amino-4-hydroxy-6-hydroxymethyldihydropteridine diphosphokinase [Pedobacter antarcticus]|uniref:2-amino-4-hydroxy-6- hydroxymethyldihydropteridine diphosphokinase n=1 Tax=Pedobacter antarcticus TaxID=34086 RepID=UPI00088AC611|nr:2-amino-4-hydroxy-6-hydroxymethyldihydropteridine diphosphokinase [Pedobacter antarcticus]SDM29703.1 2-amino-4-hydroxy-6-hydroxymethyldihydropteridinediphosphokinase [Pedobacter antarcticus]